MYMYITSFIFISHNNTTHNTTHNAHKLGAAQKKTAPARRGAVVQRVANTPPDEDRGGSRERGEVCEVELSKVGGEEDLAAASNYVTHGMAWMSDE